jgi:hypothetical protein
MEPIRLINICFRFQTDLSVCNRLYTDNLIRVQFLLLNFVAAKSMKRILLILMALLLFVPLSDAQDTLSKREVRKPQKSFFA